jgi:hypothetical protein
VGRAGDACYYRVLSTGLLADRALLYLSGKSEEFTTTQWLDAAGTATSLGMGPAPYVSMRLSPDGKRVAAVVNEGVTTSIWIYDSQRGSNRC